MYTDIFAACVSTKISHHMVHITQSPHYAIQVIDADWFLVKICGTRKSTDMCTGSVIKDKQGDIVTRNFAQHYSKSGLLYAFHPSARKELHRSV